MEESVLTVGIRRFAAVVAACENNVIGRSGQLPWRMSADLRHFRRITMGHHLVMGRKTLESIGRNLPGRTTIVVTRQQGWTFPGAVVAHSVDQVVQLTRNDNQPMLVGGGEIYKMFWDLVGTLYLTRIHAQCDGDTFLPEFDHGQWECIAEGTHPADDKNEFACTFLRCARKPEN